MILIFKYVLLFLSAVFAKNNALLGLIAFFIFSYFLSSIFRKIELKTLKISTIFFGFFIIFVGNLYWIYEPLTIELEKYFYLIPFAMVLIPSYLAIYPTVSIWILKKIINKNVYLLSIGFALIMTLSELVYSYAFTGFTWTLLGYIWSGSIIPFQIANFIGIYGLSFITYLSAALLGVYIYKKDKIAAILGISFVTLIWVFGVIRLINAPNPVFMNYTVKIVQGNIQQKDKINYLKYRSHIDQYLELSIKDSRPVDLLIWPEATVPWLYSPETEGKINQILSKVFVNCRIFAFGCIRQNSLNEIFNSIVILNNEHLFKLEQKFYDKIHLVPFGEYIPLKEYIQIESIANELDGFNIGYQPRVFQIEKSPKFLFQICYEDIFSIDKKSSKIVDCIINVTNDGWFGNSLEPVQHQYMARAMAIIYGLPTIRVNNHGYSGVFDSYGRTIVEIPLGTSGSVVFQVPRKY